MEGQGVLRVLLILLLGTFYFSGLFGLENLLTLALNVFCSAFSKQSASQIFLSFPN